MFIDRSVRIHRRDVTASLGVDKEEIEANRFAACLLMPEKMVLDAVRKASASGDREPEAFVGRLAKRFNVSVQAMELRLTNLRLAVSAF